MPNTLTITATLFLFAFQCVASVDRVDYRVRIIQQRAEDGEGESGTGGEATTVAPQPTCTAAGLVCKTCTEVFTCVPIGGALKPMKVRDCATDESCLNGNCTKAPNPKCSDVFRLPFMCNTLGMFPDPFDCRKYRICCPDATGKAHGEGASVSCIGDYAYNAKSTFCDKKIVGGKCSADLPVPLCTSVGQTAALKENPSIYYYCLPFETNPKVLYPYLFNCDNGGAYDSKTSTCK